MTSAISNDATVLHIDCIALNRRATIKIMYGGLEDGRRSAPSYDRCTAAFFPPTAIVAIIIYGL